MKHTTTFLAAIAALTGSALAHESLGNSTHVVDPATNHVIRRFGCDVTLNQATDHFVQTVGRLHQQHKNSNVGTRAAAPANKIKKPPAKPARKMPLANIQVPTYFHIISTAAHNGTVTPTMVQNQINELNAAYNPYGISFNLKNVSWTINDAWAYANGTNMASAQAALRQGTYSSLNIYFHTDLSGGLLGTCTLPAPLPLGATLQTYINDGCDVNANTMPGGSFGGYNLGKTAVHETGHWLGLLHTFEGYSCTGPGDFVTDTRVESQSTDGCPTNPWKNTCPTVPGDDPIHNYMDYSTDACYESFTQGQIQRIVSLFNEYRKGN